MSDGSGIVKIDLDKVDWRGSREFFESLTAALEMLDEKDESYDFTWVGKRKAIIEAGAPINKTLRPNVAASKNWDVTENLFIEGDNLDALKLLQECYLGKVKMIYIDPPYNTGNDFVYHDDFSMNADDYDEEMDYRDNEGNIQFRKNDKGTGRYHSDWLSMMYPRLKLARNLLSEDGTIFISIDDNESANLKKLCDEIFGEDNFINTISVNMKNVAGASGGGEDKKLKKNIEYLYVYAKSYADFESFNNSYDYFPIDELVKDYEEQGKSWKYTSVLKYEGDKRYIGSTVDGDGSEIKIYSRDNAIIKSVKTIAAEEGISEKQVYANFAHRIFQTAMPQSSIRPRVIAKVKELDAKKSDLYSIEYIPRSGKNKGKVYEQFYKGESFRLFAWLGDVSEMVDGVLCKKELQGTYWDFVGETKNLSKEGGIAFPNGKKPLRMLKRIVNMQRDKSAIALDFFAGSGTTAHAVMQLNAEDGGNRKWILVQLPEVMDKKSEEYKAGFTTIPDLTRERIRRAGEKIAVEQPDVKVDYGFRALTIADTNYKDVYKPAGQLRQANLLADVDNVKEDRSDLDLLYGVLTQSALELNRPISTTEIAGATVYRYDYFGEVSGLVACFAKDVPEEAIKAIAALKPLTAVFRDSSFADSQAKVNLAEHFRILSPETKVKVI